MVMIAPGPRIYFGIPANKVLSLDGFPKGKVRLRFRNDEFATAFVRPQGGGVHWYYVTLSPDGVCSPVWQKGCNLPSLQDAVGNRTAKPRQRVVEAV